MEMTIEVQSHYFNLLAAGKKTVEGRVRKPKFQGIQPGDTLIFKNKGDSTQLLSTHVTHVTHYASFEEMLLREGLEACLPGVTSLEAGVNLYHSFPGYQEDSLQFGVIAIAVTIPQNHTPRSSS